MFCPPLKVAAPGRTSTCPSVTVRASKAVCPLFKFRALAPYFQSSALPKTVSSKFTVVVAVTLILVSSAAVMELAKLVTLIKFNTP